MLRNLDFALATEHERTLLRQACHDRLARLALCCQPSALRRRVGSAMAWLRAGQLGRGYVPPCCDA